jgi:hypothetical protein
MKGHTGISDGLPYYIVHWNARMVTISAFQSDVWAVSDELPKT